LAIRKVFAISGCCGKVFIPLTLNEKAQLLAGLSVFFPTVSIIAGGTKLIRHADIVDP
jgi:hypothetical protein